MYNSTITPNQRLITNQVAHQLKENDSVIFLSQLQAIKMIAASWDGNEAVMLSAARAVLSIMPSKDLSPQYGWDLPMAIDLATASMTSSQALLFLFDKLSMAIAANLTQQINTEKCKFHQKRKKNSFLCRLKLKIEAIWHFFAYLMESR